MLRKYLLMEEAKDGTEGGAADDKTNAETKTADTAEVKTVLTAEAKDAEAKAEPITWPSDWQEKAAKGDEKRLAHLKRYASPEAAFDAMIAAQNRIRSGDLKSALPENPKPEELAQWRKDNGIPEAPDKYDLKFDDGLVIGEADKPVMDEFLKTAHESNLTPAQVKQVVQWHYKNEERIAEATAARDEQHKTEVLNALYVEWGTKYQSEMNLIKGSVLSIFPEKVRNDLIGARLPDGRGVFNSTDVLRALSAIAHIVNPAGVVTPSGSGDMAKTIDDEIKMIESKMGTKEYIKDQKMQDRYLQLVTARDSLKKAA